MTAMEEIVGHLGDHRFKEHFDRLDQKYFRPLLQREPVSVDDQLMALYAEIMLRLLLLSLVIFINQNPVCVAPS